MLISVIFPVPVKVIWAIQNTIRNQDHLLIKIQLFSIYLENAFMHAIHQLEDIQLDYFSQPNDFSQGVNMPFETLPLSQVYLSTLTRAKFMRKKYIHHSWAWFWQSDGVIRIHRTVATDFSNGPQMELPDLKSKIWLWRPYFNFICVIVCTVFKWYDF